MMCRFSEIAIRLNQHCSRNQEQRKTTKKSHEREDEKIAHVTVCVCVYTISNGNATEFTAALAVVTPHGASNVLTCNRLNHDWASLLHDPHKGVGHVEDVRVRETLLLEELEPVTGNSVKCRSLF